jgi:transcriptional regulator with XRE-family HTH domain
MIGSNMNNLKKIRKEIGISITDLAKSIGMSQSNLTKIENNQLKAKDDIIVKIAQTLNVSKDVLFQTENQVSNCYLLPIINSTEIGLQDQSQYPIPAYILKQNNFNTCVYIIQDDTMFPTIHKSAVVLINKEIKAFDKNGIYLVKINNKTFLRRLQEVENGMLVLTDNKLYAPQQTELENIEIIGKAFYVFNSSPL